MAAASAGVKTVLIPKDNMRNLPDLDPGALAVLDVRPCSTLADVLSEALVPATATLSAPVKKKAQRLPARGLSGVKEAFDGTGS